ncbi:MAG: hypothetical protein V8T45_07445 [Oscillospiraceae bacterium]
MTQYYFVFYAFFLCAAYVLYALIKRQYKALLWFVPWALAGALALLLVFPQCMDQLFADKLVSGGNAMENLRDISQSPQRFMYYFAEARHGLKAAGDVTILALLALVLLFKRFRAAAKDGKLCLEALVIILPAFVVFPVVAIVSPVMDQRYIYNIVPFFIVAVCLLLHSLDVVCPLSGGPGCGRRRRCCLSVPWPCGRPAALRPSTCTRNMRSMTLWWSSTPMSPAFTLPTTTLPPSPRISCS